MKHVSVGLLAFLFVSIASAFTTNQKIPYYGEQFYQELATGATDDSLRDNLQEVLRSYHLKTTGLDQIVKSCAGANCYSHVALGYDRARIFLMGVYHLIDRGHGQYAIFDVYCDRERTASDFAGTRGPAPHVVPDANILNTEHTWPQSHFTGRFAKDMQKSDLHHLFPTDNQMNSIRGNNPFGEVVRDSQRLKCPVARTGKSAEGQREVFEPPRAHKGNVARALFYFAVRYEMNIDREEEATLRKWHREDPVDEAEMDRNTAVQKVQGNRNPFIDHPELTDLIHDF